MSSEPAGAAEEPPCAAEPWTAVGDGKVRQKAEQTDDGGGTWRVIWDSYYVPK